MNLSPQHQEALGAVVELVGQLLGDDLDLVGPIGMDTCFNADLELESIEFVALAELLSQRYGDVDFVGWISGKELDEIIALTVGDLVEHIVSCQS